MKGHFDTFFFKYISFSKCSKYVVIRFITINVETWSKKDTLLIDYKLRSIKILSQLYSNVILRFHKLVIYHNLFNITQYTIVDNPRYQYRIF